MLSFLVLIILIMIVQQIKYSSDAEARVARNAETVAMMDQAIESVLLQAYEDLRTDGESSGGEEGSDASGPAPGLDGGLAADGEGAGSSDSKQDAWAKPQRTELNGMQLRVFIQDEDSKFNILSLAQEDEEQADRALETLVRILSACRADTISEIPSSDARAMAGAMREFMTRRDDQYLPRPNLSSYDEDQPDQGLPQSLYDFAALDPSLFTENLFIDYRDEEGQVVHSLSSFLTVWSCMSTLSAPGGAAAAANAGAGGGAGASGSAEASNADGRINVNTAPPAVLTALLENQDVPYDFWDDIIEYRNEPEEEDEDLDPDEVPLDEFGEEQINLQFFESFDQLTEIDAWDGMATEIQDELSGMLKVESSVFSIFVTARRLTGQENIDARGRPEEVERQEEESAGLVRTVRSVVWRRSSDNGEASIVPLVRWEVLNYVPKEVLDYPDERR